eukprot:6813854-Pyramimonas_sp.AAC.1
MHVRQRYIAVLQHYPYSYSTTSRGSAVREVEVGSPSWALEPRRREEEGCDRNATQCVCIVAQFVCNAMPCNAVAMQCDAIPMRCDRTAMGRGSTKRM